MPSLERRVVRAFALFAFALASLFAVLVWSGMHLAEDMLVKRNLSLELAEHLERRASDPAAPLPSNSWLRSTTELRDLPPEIQAVANRPDGVHEVGLPLLEDLELFLLIHTLPSGKKLYLYVDALQIEVLDASLGMMAWVLLISTIVVTALGAMLGRSTAHRVVAPVLHLADAVRRQDPKNHQTLAGDIGDDEVRVLAMALDAAAERSQGFLERERRFTRDASHELRTPITVVRGAVELLEQDPSLTETSALRPLARIRRANEEMSRLVEAFLWLSREEALADSGRHRSLAAEVDEAIERHRHLLEGKTLELRRDIDGEAQVVAPRGVLGIVLGNLIANAFHYTQEGWIEIAGDDRTLSITDSGPGIAVERLDTVLEPHRHGNDSAGFGLGLAICRDLCERFGWLLELSSGGKEGAGTQALVRFQ